MISRIFDDISPQYDEPQPRATSARTQSSGQVAVEYVLLLAIGVTIAALVTSLVVSRNPDKPGFLIAKWKQIITLIATDKIEE